MIKNRIHAMLAGYGIRIHATDIFGRHGLREIEESSARMHGSDRVVLADMITMVSEIKDRESIIEDEISRMAVNRDDVRILMTIPGIHVYSATAILAEIDNISRFPSKEEAGRIYRSRAQAGSVW